jgi:hypothetical protein
MNAAEAARWLAYARSDLAGLTIWAVEARYPSDMPDVVEDDAHEALQIAEAVYQNVANDLHRYNEG